VTAFGFYFLHLVFVLLPAKKAEGIINEEDLRIMYLNNED